ncbi:MAG: ATP phosphoribosyltransferase regulatory subunit, partial [Acholeplasmatales bacterium]|nr:ATP phosphoribosyltransferase regulatory subunit [Acholeplasmatales bacterium]
VLDIFKHHGYELIKTPTLEYIDVYSKDGLQKPDLYNLINHQGEVLALCNDMTSSIARFVSSNNSLPKGPKKYSYVADTFRYPRLYQGKNHQFLQAGVEFIGKGGIMADSAIIMLASNCLKACNVSNFTIHLGSSRFLGDLLKDFNLPKEVRKKVYEYMDLKDYVSLRNLFEESLDENDSSFLINLILKGGKLHYILNLMERLKGYNSYSELVYLHDVYCLLDKLGVNNIIFDFSIYSYQAYYTGIIFSIYVDGVSKSVLMGGRCDKLLNGFGADLEDCGFGLDIDSLAKYCLDNNLINVENKKYLALVSKENYLIASKVNQELRNNNIIVSAIDFDTLDEAIKYAKDFDFDSIITYTENDYKIMEVKKC